MTENVAESVFRIEVPLPGNPLKFLNSYFIQGSAGERNLLIDTGFNMPQCRQALEEGLQELGADLAETDLYLTHMHSDHIGLAPVLQRAGMQMYMSAADIALLQQGIHGKRWDEYDALYFAEGFSAEQLERLTRENPARAYAPESVPEFTPVSDGTILHYGGMDLEVILVPGHTPGNTVLYCRDRKLMFLSDHVLFNITPNIISWKELPDALGCYCGSLRKIRTLPVEIPLPGHRGVTCTMEERIDQILEHHARRLTEALAIVKEAPGMNCYQIAARMKWKIRTAHNTWEEFPLGQKWFAVGEAMAHMEYLIHAGKVRKQGRPDGTVVYEAV